MVLEVAWRVPYVPSSSGEREAVLLCGLVFFCRVFLIPSHGGRRGIFIVASGENKSGSNEGQWPSPVSKRGTQININWPHMVSARDGLLSPVALMASSPDVWLDIKRWLAQQLRSFAWE